MKFSIEFDTDNAAFDDAPVMEIREVLRRVFYAAHQGETEGICRDTNGNTIGHWSWGE